MATNASRPTDGAGPVRVILRPVGTPTAIGLGAIMIGTTMLSGLQLQWLSGRPEQQTVAIVGIAAAFPLELIAAIFALLARDALAGTGLAIFSTIWSVSGITLLTGPVGGTNDALGMFLILGAIALGLLLISAGRSRLVFGVIIVIGSIRLLLTGLYEIEATTGLEHAAGIVGLVLAAACAYGIVALLQEDLPRRSFLPVGRSGRGASSIRGALGEQLDDLEHEAGVRRLL